MRGRVTSVLSAWGAYVLTAAALFALLLVQAGAGVRPNAMFMNPSDARAEPSPTPTPKPTVMWTPPAAVLANAQSAATAKANELGWVPVLMYHRILTKRKHALDRTPTQLHKELTRLAQEGYVPVTAAEFVAGRIEIPAGKYPVVLTFDDGSPTHLAFDPATATPMPDTAVGVILDVARRNPGFRPTATFWVNKDPFGLHGGDAATAVHWLTQSGFEVANHTWSHKPLNRLPPDAVAAEIVRSQRQIMELGGGTSTTMALPYGNMPRPRGLAMHGEWDGTTYGFAGVFLAGASPSASPYATDFNPLGIQRIQSNVKRGECRKYCSDAWLDWLARHPHRRYASDGDPARISFPRELGRWLKPEHSGQANPY